MPSRLRQKAGKSRQGQHGVSLSGRRGARRHSRGRPEPQLQVEGPWVAWGCNRVGGAPLTLAKVHSPLSIALHSHHEKHRGYFYILKEKVCEH